MRSCLGLAAVLLFSSMLMAQSSSKRLTITVEDPSGAPIPGASVHIFHWEQSASPTEPHRQVEDASKSTDAKGEALFNLTLNGPDGFYDILASAPAFVSRVAFVRVPAKGSNSGQVFKFRLSIQSGGGVEISPN